MWKYVNLNEYGFLELSHKVSENERKAMFEKEYFQACMGTYAKKYSEFEIEYFSLNCEFKDFLIKKYIGLHHGERKCNQISILDIGCGEGYSLKWFHDHGYEVLGIDYSSYGIQLHNSEMMPFFLQGDGENVLEKLSGQNKVFDVINMDSVLDMVYSPVEMINKCKKVLSRDGIIIIKVNNNYSCLQEYLCNTDRITEENWVDDPGHLSYFNKDGIENLCKYCGLQIIELLGEMSIEFNLFNDNTNYYKNVTVGKSCHQSRVEIEKFLMKSSIDDYFNIRRSLGNMGIGRQLTAVFR